MAGILLAATTDKLQLVTDAAVSVDVHASYADYASGTTTASKQNTAISTATTTDIVAAPGASTVRNIKTMTIRNKSALTSVGVTLVFDQNGTDFELYRATLSAGAQLTYSENGGFVVSNYGTTTPWYGRVYAAAGNGDPQLAWSMAVNSGTVAATPTNITTSVARVSYFRLPQDFTVNKIRYYGVGGVTTTYRIAIYNGDTLARILTETAFTTTANTWGEIGSSLALSLAAGQLYFIACSVNATGTTAGVLCLGSSVAPTTGQVQVLPKSFPGNLDIDSGYFPGPMFAQGAVTTGALPDPFPTVAVQSSWTGGMPLFFLDNSNA